MGSFLGAAFGFGARDVGFEAAIGSAVNSLDNINNLLDEQDKKGSSVGKMWKGMRNRVKEFNVASIAGDMRTLTGETGNLSNSMESMAASYAQASKPIIASMNLTAKEAQKMNSQVVGMAIGLNTGAEAVAETFKAIHSAGEPARQALEAMAMTEKEWVKVTQTTGVAMDQFVGVMGDMVASWGASGEQAGEMINNIMAIGKAADVGTEAIKGMKGQLDAIDEIFEELPPSMARTSDEIQSLMESTYKLSGAFRDMGDTEADAVARAQDTAKMFAQQSVLIEKLYAMGGEGALDDSPLFKFLTQLGVGTEEARDIINEGSRDVVKGVTRINEKFAEMGGDTSPQVQYALAELNKAMGQSSAGLGWLASNTDQGTKSLDRMNKLVVQGESALKDYGKQAFSTGRTLQDQLNFAQERFDTQLRKVGRKEAKDFVKRQSSAYREVGKEIQELGSDETWGPLVNYLSVFRQAGMAGIGQKLAKDIGGEEAAQGAAKFGVGLGVVVDTAKQLGDELGPAMDILGKFGPLGMAAGGIATWFMMSDEQKNQIKKVLKPLIDWIGKSLKEQFDKMADPDTVNSIVEKAGSVVKGIIDVAIDWGSIGKKFMDSIDWTKLGRNFAIALGSAFKGTTFGTITGIEKAGHEAAAEEARMGAEASSARIIEGAIEESRRLGKDIESRMKYIAQQRKQLADLEDQFFAGGIGEREFQEQEMWFLEQIKDEQAAIQESGKLITDNIAMGMEHGEPQMKEMVDAVLSEAVKKQLPQSPPEEGPLQGDYLPNTGAKIIQMIGDGMLQEAPNFTMLMSEILEESAIQSLEAYNTKVEEWSKKKSLLRSVARQMVEEFGGELSLGKVDVQGDTLSAKQTFETALNLPGLAGVVAAIASDGHKTRVLLKKIWEDTHSMATSEMFKSGAPNTGAASPALPS